MCHRTLLVHVVILLTALNVQTSYGRTLSEIASLCIQSSGLVCDPDRILTQDQGTTILKVKKLIL